MSDMTRRELCEALSASPLGRCVYRCDNDVVDHQVVAMEMEDGVTATFTMTAFTRDWGRLTRIHGTEGELFFDEKEITIKPFKVGGKTRVIKIPEQRGSHGGGDGLVVRNWLEAIKKNAPKLVKAGAQESLRTHLYTFAAEKSRREGRRVMISEMT